MSRVHVRLDLEDETGELVFSRLHHALLGCARQRRRCVLHEVVQQLLDAEIAQRGAEEHRRLFCPQVGVEIERRAGALHEFDLVAEAHRHRCPAPAPRRPMCRPSTTVWCGCFLPPDPVIQVDPVLQQVIDALQRAAHADRPGDRRALNLEHRFDLVEQIDRLAAVAVQLVDEGHDRRIAQAADFHQLDRALLDALGAVDHHQRRIDRRQRAIGVLGEVLVARRVEQIDDVIA